MNKRFIDGVFRLVSSGELGKANDPIAWQGDGGNGLEKITGQWKKKLTVFFRQTLSIK